MMSHRRTGRYASLSLLRASVGWLSGETFLDLIFHICIDRYESAVKVELSF